MMWETTRNNARGRKLLRALMRLVKLRFIQIRHELPIRKKKKKKRNNAYIPGMTNTLIAPPPCIAPQIYIVSVKCKCVSVLLRNLTAATTPL